MLDKGNILDFVCVCGGVCMERERETEKDRERETERSISFQTQGFTVSLLKYEKARELTVQQQTLD